MVRYMSSLRDSNANGLDRFLGLTPEATSCRRVAAKHVLRIAAEGVLRVAAEGVRRLRRSAWWLAHRACCEHWAQGSRKQRRRLSNTNNSESSRSIEDLHFAT